ncbi:MAG: DUF2194 domain-containing protein [Flavobacterium sp.]|nr:MAG: DUF2194 domain-containing protein [Flavobacterium sp.]
MPNLTFKTYYFKKLILFFAIALSAFSCGKLDNLDSDDFDLFGDNDRRTSQQLRRYSDSPMDPSPLIEFIVDPANPLSVQYEKQIRKACDYTKMPYRMVEASELNQTLQIPESARVLCLVDGKKLSDESINRLVTFVASGGSLFVPFAAEDKRLGFLLGFRPDADRDTDIKSKGFFFETPVLPNLTNQNYNAKAIHFGYAGTNFSDKVRVLATAVSNKKYPTVLENPVGKGKVLFYNTSLAFEKIDRGFLFAGILHGLEGVPYPIVNASTIFLDDFPSPLYDIKFEPIKSEMNLTVTDFVSKVWWPDMRALAKKYKISYSSMICFDYKNTTEPPFLFDQWEAHRIKDKGRSQVLSDWLIRDVAKNGHELSFHGYNHVEFKEGHWKNRDFIITALNGVRKKWEVSNYGPMPVTYVPPSNIIDKKGVKELTQGMPSIKFMCSVYLGELSEGGAREYDFDPYNPDLFDYPRLTDAFSIPEDQQYSRESTYLITGIWNHFVHPDDVYQIADPKNISQGDFDLRNPDGLGWRKTKGKDRSLLGDFDKYLAKVTAAFPQMRFLNAGEGAMLTNDWRASKFKHHSETGSYTVAEVDNEKSITDNQYWFMYGTFTNAARLESQLQDQGAVFTKTPFQDGYLYNIFTKKPKLTLRDLMYVKPDNVAAAQLLTKKAGEEYRRFLANVKRYDSGGYVENWEDDSDAKFKAELVQLKTRMLSEATIDTAIWNKYARYMTWDDRGAEVWKMLEDHCVKHPSSKNIMYSRELNRIVEYPNDQIREKWMAAQMLINPDDKDLVMAYMDSYQAPENQEKIKNALVALMKTDKSFPTYLQYLKYLLQNDPPGALKELQDKQPSEEYRVLAGDISWLFANDNQFQKAYDWSVFTDDIDFQSKMSWLIELKSYQLLETEYDKYIAKHPDDFKVKAAMAGVLHDTGRFKDSWVLADGLPDTPEKNDLRDMLNKDVIYVEPELQMDLLDNHPNLFLPEVSQQLEKNFRKERGDFLAYNTSAESNKADPSAFKNVLSYNHYDKHANLHSFAATYSTMYDIEYLVKDRDNVTHAIGGIQYQFNNPKSYEKLQYWLRGRVEYSDYQRFYYLFGMGANISKNKNYKSAEFKIFPAETGPAYSKRIYRMQLNIYEDWYFLKYINASLSLEGNYYTPSKPNTNIKTSDSYEGSITGKITLDNGVEKKSKFLPFLEGSLSQGSLGHSTVPLSTGYPYWMIDERLYGGGGIGWKYGLSDSNLNTRVEAAYFFDDYSKEFERYTGEINYQIFDYTALSLSFEIYTQSKFYSNNLQFGVKYNLKRHKKK